MKERNRRAQQRAQTEQLTAPVTASSAPAGASAFTFGDPMPVMNRADLLDYAELVSYNGWYEPPISLAGLAKSFRAGTHHASALYFKRNVLASTFIPHRLLSRDTFRRWALDFLMFGNGYVERQKNRLGGTLKFEAAPGKYMRRRVDMVSYAQTDGWKVVHEFEAGAVHHLIEPDVNQEVYGMPEYLGALHAAWLNESSTLFRRRYYENGSHAGFILYLTDAAQSQDDVDALRDALKSAKGPGNFRNLFYYAPNGKKDGLQLIPVSEVAAKDEFFNIKNITRDDLLAAHRVPPQLLGIVPSNTGGFGAADTAAKVFGRNEITPLQNQFLAFNDWAGDEIVRFSSYTLDV
ncbi:PBSX family phage portal protein [Paraburkholderia eburnea]|uniref:PBSX family phage portal protein n=1 Tax=Paraburkholderia eburnea TaxID=1189126 RepID=A0A2S4LWA0_9BURK|nr:phage portal protein [Paraburkholderia eburnea]POR46732.1 PBSX family phage portal protein [Paraburkholderia eburnea]PRZ17921.1 PBSX family phage portal protein [Paraburkholderia eburnea]